MTAALDYLRSSPLFWVFVTVAGYRAGVWLRDRTGGHPLAQPVLVGIIIVISVVSVLGVDYDTYFEGGAMIHFLLGPATVALAVPLYRQAHRLRVMLLSLLVAIPIGAAASIISCWVRTTCSPAPSRRSRRPLPSRSRSPTRSGA